MLVFCTKYVFIYDQYVPCLHARCNEVKYTMTKNERCVFVSVSMGNCRFL